jgi:prevent-host-death family protein
VEKINMRQAKTQFARLLNRAQAGEEFVITKAGYPSHLLLPAIAS